MTGRQKYRPKARWFVVGGVLLVLAPVVFVAALFTVLGPLAEQDAVVAADGRPHALSLPGGTERALFTRQGARVDCALTDNSGAEVRLGPVGGEFTVNDWRAVARFDTGDGDLILTCDPGEAGEVRIGPTPALDSFVGGVVVGIVGPMLLGGAGIVVLVVIGVLYATRPPRPAT